MPKKKDCTESIDIGNRIAIFGPGWGKIVVPWDRTEEDLCNLNNELSRYLRQRGLSWAGRLYGCANPLCFKATFVVDWEIQKSGGSNVWSCSRHCSNLAFPRGLGKKGKRLGFGVNHPTQTHKNVCPRGKYICICDRVCPFSCAVECDRFRHSIFYKVEGCPCSLFKGVKT